MVLLRRFLSPVASVCFIAIFVAQSFPVYAAQGSLLSLPEPGKMISISAKFVPAYVKGISIYPDDPFKFDFIIDTGDTKLNDQQFKEESNKLIKYFMAALTVPDKEDWVNLSPYEKDHIIPESLGITEMGRDMLAQDYILKQLTSSLIYPEKGIGKEFWSKVYAQAQKQFGTTNVPINTFNKVWIVPSQAVVWEHDNSAYVVRSHLKVMLEQDYLSLNKHLNNNIFSGSGMDKQDAKTTNAVGSNVVREVVLPALEKEVNEGANFATVRQVFNSAILAAWYKQNLQQTILGQVYSNKDKVAGINLADKQIKQQIYERYLQAFKKGAFNFIKEDDDPVTHQSVPRKYFSGGVVDLAQVTETLHGALVSLPKDDQAAIADGNGSINRVTVEVVGSEANASADQGMLSGGEVYKALDATEEGRKAVIMATNIRMPLSAKGILLGAKETNSVAVFQQAISELGYTWPNGYSLDNPQALADMIKGYADQIGYHSYVLKGDHITAKVDKDYLADKEAQQIVVKLFENILAEKDVAKRGEMFLAAAASPEYNSNVNVANALKAVKKAYELVLAEVKAGFSIFALDASFMPMKQNIMITAFLDGFIPASASHEAEVGEIGGAQNSTVGEAVEFIEGLKGYGVDISRLAINNGTEHGNKYGPDGKLIATSINLDATSDIAEALKPYRIEIVQHGITGTSLENISTLRAAGIRSGHVGTQWQNIFWAELTKAAERDPKGPAAVLRNRMIDTLVERYGNDKKYSNVTSRQEAESKGVLDALIGMELKNINGMYRKDILALPQDVQDEIVMATKESAVDHFNAFGATGTAKLVADYQASQQSTADQAMLNGGINLDAALYNMQVLRDGNGMVLPISQQPIGQFMKIKGFKPVLLNIEHNINLPARLGVKQASTIAG